MNNFVNALLLCYATLFPIINPVGNMPLFLSLTRKHSKAERLALSRKVALNSFVLLIGSLFVGSYVLEFFGLSLAAVRIGGGLVITAFGWRMLNSGDNLDTDVTTAGPAPKAPDGFYPYTMPLTVGPGSISVAIALGSQRPHGGDVMDILLIGAAAIIAVVAICLTIFLCYRFAETVVARLGQGGMNVVIRLAAFILMCIGIQMIWSGWQGLAQTH